MSHKNDYIRMLNVLTRMILFLVRTHCVLTIPFDSFLCLTPQSATMVMMVMA